MQVFLVPLLKAFIGNTNKKQNNNKRNWKTTESHLIAADGLGKSARSGPQQFQKLIFKQHQVFSTAQSGDMYYHPILDLWTFAVYVQLFGLRESS